MRTELAQRRKFAKGIKITGGASNDGVRLHIALLSLEYSSTFLSRELIDQ